MDHDDLTDRLRALGEQPVPEATRHQHLQRMTTTAPAAPARRFGRFAVAAAAVVGFFAGSTGLAMAGALPDPAQDVAHDVLSTISVQVPEGGPGHRGACVSAAAKIADPEAKATAKAACPKGGKPAAGGEGPGRSGDAPGRTQADKHADDPCRGKPPWAGRKDMTEAEKQAAKEQRAAECGRTLDADDAAEEQQEAAEDAAEREREAAEEQQEAAEEQQEEEPAPPPEAPVAEPEAAPVAPDQPEAGPDAGAPAPEPGS